MKVIVIPVTPYQQNCSLVICEKTNKAAIIDPGGNHEKILEIIESHGVIIEKIILTHGHLDHVGDTQRLNIKLKVPVIGPEKEDAFWLNQLEAQCKHMGFPITKSFLPDDWLKEGDVVDVGAIKFEVIHVPGHTPGHIALYDRSSAQVIVGDILFNGGIGRFDFPKSNGKLLIAGIKLKLLSLPAETVVYPGHGATTTIGHEKASNPFLR
ncbi:MAG: MBL fold metallo-hydrolase [Psychromonas sp.]|nr:MBL fold metallo-hydrolase [Psychromonas sp.]